MPDTARKHYSSVILIVLGDDLDPDFVTAALCLQPDQAWRRGQTEGKHVYKWGGWKKFIDVGVKDASLADQLTHWLPLLQERSESLRTLRDCGYTILLDCLVGSSESIHL